MDPSIPDAPPALERVGHITLSGDSDLDVFVLAVLAARNDKLTAGAVYLHALRERADAALAADIDAVTRSDWRALLPALRRRYAALDTAVRERADEQMRRAMMLDDLSGRDPHDHPVSPAEYLHCARARHTQVALLPLAHPDPLVRAIGAATILAGDDRQGRANPYLAVLYAALDALAHACRVDPDIIHACRVNADAFDGQRTPGAVFRFGHAGWRALCVRLDAGECIDGRALIAEYATRGPQGTLRELYLSATVPQRIAVAALIDDFAEWFAGLSPEALTPTSG